MNVETDQFSRLLINEVPLLDVRAPIEFEQGAFPAATNLPLLNDQERQAVGTRYRQAGQASAIELGELLVSGTVREARLQQWLAFTAQHPTGCLYCLRGGLRSRTVQQWLAAEGIDYPLVVGGYKALRRYLIHTLDSAVASTSVLVLAGRTGAGKTRVLQRLERAIDLEGLARHRGSSFGALPQRQPTPINFENALAIAWLRLQRDDQRPLILEDEGRLIGNLCIPQSLRERLPTYPAVELVATLDERILISLDTYIVELLQMFQALHGPDAGFDALAQHHRDSLHRIRKRFGHSNANECLTLFELALTRHREDGSTDRYWPYIRRLLSDYYDPMYDYQMSQKHRPIVYRGTAPQIIDWIGAVDVPELDRVIAASS